MILSLWAKKWGVSSQAIEDLRDTIVAQGVDTHSKENYGLESRAQSEVRLEAADKGLRLWRNNVGAHKTDTGFLRYGLANDSTAVNKRIKSADLIGIKPITITPEHVGCVLGQLVSREIKRPGWVYKGTGREEAQLNWALLVLSFGGDAAFATGKGTL